MRALTEEETKVLFAKLANYTGTSLKNLIAPLDNSPNGDRYVFRLHQSRCYYVLLSIANLATSVGRDQLLSLGTCLGMLSPSPLPSQIPRTPPPFQTIITAIRTPQLTPPQANSPKPSNSGSTSPPSPSSPPTRATSSGSSPTARCPSCTAATSSKRTSGAGPRTAPSTRASSCTA